VFATGDPLQSSDKLLDQALIWHFRTEDSGMEDFDTSQADILTSWVCHTAFLKVWYFLTVYRHAIASSDSSSGIILIYKSNTIIYLKLTAGKYLGPAKPLATTL
jgi:hypothetical protein